MALPGGFLSDSQVSFLDKPACGAGVLIGINIRSLQSFIPLLMFGLHVALEWMERGLSFLLTVAYPLGTISFHSPAFPLPLIFTEKILSTHLHLHLHLHLLCWLSKT